MSTGIRAEVRVDAPAECPIARLSAEEGVPSNSVSRSVSPDATDTVAEEFVLDADAAVDPDDEPFEEVFSYGAKTVYRFERERGIGCPCECVERFGCPVVDVHARPEGLHLVFHAPDMDHLQSVLGDLKESFTGIDVTRLIRSEGDGNESDLVFVDRSELTDRQREVLETANAMGYFEHPKQANAGEVADALGITTSTFTEHLAAAQSKLLDALLDG